MKLAVFDFDSTLMDGETIDFFAAELGLEEKVALITEQAMRGKLDFFESLITIKLSVLVVDLELVLNLQKRNLDLMQIFQIFCTIKMDSLLDLLVER